MSYTINNVTLVGGNLVRDAELKRLTSGTAKAQFDMAMNRSYMNKSTNETVEETSYFRVVLWGKPAEVLIDYLRKGKKVAVEGRLNQRRWTADDGSTRSIVEIVASNVVLMGSPGRGGSQNDGGASRPSPQSAPGPDYGSGLSNDDVPF